MTCPTCKNALRLSPKRRFLDCHLCGYSILLEAALNLPVERVYEIIHSSTESYKRVLEAMFSL